jgi:hypothetical protein
VKQWQKIRQKVVEEIYDAAIMGGWKWWRKRNARHGSHSCYIDMSHPHRENARIRVSDHPVTPQEDQFLLDVDFTRLDTLTPILAFLSKKVEPIRVKKRPG